MAFSRASVFFIYYYVIVQFICNFASQNVKKRKMSVNKVILIGNVGKDPEVRHLDRNMAVANIVLATTERGYTLQNGTQPVDGDDFNIPVMSEPIQQGTGDSMLGI